MNVERKNMAGFVYRTLRENVVDAIRMKIINQEIKPGTRIVEMDLAAEFQTSRGPIREALRQLENEGLIEYTRNVGCSVKTITVDDSYEIYLMRSSYEVMAVKLFKGKIPEETIKNMKKILEEFQKITVEEYEKVFKCDNDFHGELIKMTKMERLYKAWKELNYGNVISGYSAELDKEKVLARQYAIHKELLDALEGGNTTESCKAIVEHYMRTIKRISKEQNIEEREFDWEFLI